jgi:hypothetical protein
LVRAAEDVSAHYESLRRVVQQLPPMHHALALDLMRGWRMYCFEQNYQRWPDGRYYLLDRDYQHWRRHRIGFDLEQLRAFGVCDWSRRVRGLGYKDGILPLQSESLQHRPGRRLREFTALVGRIAEHLRQLADERVKAGATQ